MRRCVFYKSQLLTSTVHPLHVPIVGWIERKHPAVGSQSSSRSQISTLRRRPWICEGCVVKPQLNSTPRQNKIKRICKAEKVKEILSRMCQDLPCLLLLSVDRTDFTKMR